MDNLEIAKALFGQKPQTASSSGQTTTAYGTAVSDSVNGSVRVNLGGDTESIDDDQSIEVDTTFAVFEGDEVIVSLVGADGTGKAPCVIGVVGRGDQQQTEINSVTNYVWNDAAGLHVSTQERSVQGPNILIDSDSMDIRNGNSNSEADQTVYASFGREVTVGDRRVGEPVGQYSQAFGHLCKASGNYSHCEGYKCTASGNYSHAEGMNCTAAGNYSHAEGQMTTATGQYSHAEGATCEAGTLAHAEGSVCKALGDASHAEGMYTEATAYAHYAHVEGYRTTVSRPASHVQGKYNVIFSGLLSENYADVIGNGTADDARSNAYNMDWYGNAEFQGEVYVGGCTVNGETPYPVVRYNTSNSKQEYYDKGDSSWKALSGSGGGASWVSLWDNPDPSSNFSAQTVSLDLSDWTFIAIVTQFSTSHDYESVNMVRVGGKSALETANLFSTQYTAKRSAEVTSSGVTFSTGYRDTTGTTGTNYCIPIAIYGVAVEYNLDWKTFSGAIINFTTIKAHAIQSAVVNFSASQDLNGYDKPWAGGAGKNKYSGQYLSISTNYLLFFGTRSSSGVSTYGMDVDANTTYTATITLPSSPSRNWGVYAYYTGSSQMTFSANASGATRTFSFTPSTNTKVIFWAYIGGSGWASEGVTTDNVQLQIEVGSEATDYEPYSNICPISGWSDIEIYRETQYDAGATPYVTVNFGGTQYGGNLEAVSGTLTLTHGYIASYNGETLPSTWISDRDEYAVGTTPTTGAEVVYELASPTTVQLTPHTITALQGANAMWSNVGNITVVARGE